METHNRILLFLLLLVVLGAVSMVVWEQTKPILDLLQSHRIEDLNRNGSVLFHQGEGYQVALVKSKGRVWPWSPMGLGMATGWIRAGGRSPDPRTVVEVIGVGCMGQGKWVSRET